MRLSLFSREMEDWREPNTPFWWELLISGKKVLINDEKVSISCKFSLIYFKKVSISAQKLLIK
ncbi:hypothetical protein BIV60_07490 [Bacillus sp. MUM 116]|nr:hypothetical protein BIV60_07490 [Bacillus sp. MUM 116]